MVFILDNESFFNAPLDTVWKLWRAHVTDGERIHPDNRNQIWQKVGENSFVVSWENEVQGQTVKGKAKIVEYVPLGQAFEVLEGPMAGSKWFNFYIPAGDRTRVILAGKWTSPIMPDDQLKQMVPQFNEKTFNEDVTYLSKMR